MSACRFLPLLTLVAIPAPIHAPGMARPDPPTAPAAPTDRHPDLREPADLHPPPAMFHVKPPRQTGAAPRENEARPR